MSTLPRFNNAYGFSQPQIQVFPVPIVANRNPTTADKGELGQIWIIPTTNTAWMLVSIIANVATWIDFAGGAAANSFVTNSGTAVPVAGVLDVLGDSTNIDTSGAGNTVTITLRNTIHLPATNAAATAGVIFFNSIPVLQALGTGNMFAGLNAGNFTLTTGSAVDNSGLGDGALHALTTGASNTAVGFNSSLLLTTGSDNTAVGSSSLDAIVTGSHNIAIGFGAASTFTTSESSNIIIGNVGVISDANTIRIGTTGSGSGQQNLCYIAGINGVSISAATVVGITGDQLATTTITAGTGIAITPSSGEITISTIDAGLPWTDVTSAGPTPMLVNNGYIANNNSAVVQLTLPAVAAEGSIIRVSGKGTDGWQIQQNASQTIHFGAFNTTTGTGGSLSSSLQYDTVELLCTTANTDFVVQFAVGNLTIV